jgi:vitamin B12 transporter
MKKYLYILIIFLSNDCFGQIKDVHVLPQVLVVKNSIQPTDIGRNIQVIDSAKMLQNNFGNIDNQLNTGNNIFVKSNGISNLKTVSVRGSSASQVAIVWNGFNLNMLSQSLVDLSLVPSFFVDKLEIQYGANMVDVGSGAIGATIELNSNLHFNTGHHIKFGHQVASFQSNVTNAQYSFGNAKFVSSTKVFYSKAKNNFPYYINGLPSFGTQLLENNTALQQGILQENKWQMNKNTILQSGIWLQHTDRNLPPSITSVNTKETQIDNHARLFVSLQQSYTKYLHTAKVAAFQEYLLYNNPIISINDAYTSNRINVESNNGFICKFGTFGANVQYQFGELLSTKHINNPIQHRVAFTGTWCKQLLSAKWNNLLSIRQELTQQQTMPFTASLNSSYYIIPNFKCNMMVHNMYRIPSFNDLFWLGSGNPNLLPENGIGAELGVVYTHKTKPKKNNVIDVLQPLNPFPKSSFSICTYTRNISNWILWLPNTSSTWQPQNVQQVWSRGLESNANFCFTLKKISLQLCGNFAFTKSTIEKTSVQERATLYQQLIYTPIHSGSLSVDASYHGWQLHFQHQMLGNVFTTADNKNDISGYTIQNVQLSKNIYINKHSITFNSGINNMANKNYQVIAFRPMPLRNYFVSMQCNLHL